MAVTDDSGRFEFRGVPSGDYEFSVAPLGYRRLLPIHVTVRHGDTASVEARLKQENRVADCLEIQTCAKVLNSVPNDAELTDADRLREAALRTAVAIVVEEGWRLGDFVVCVDEPSARIRRALSSGIPDVVESAECSLAAAPSSRTSALAHKATGKRAVAFSAKIERQSEVRATATVANYVGPRWGAGWTCEFKREDAIWTAVSCRMNWIS